MKFSYPERLDEAIHLQSRGMEEFFLLSSPFSAVAALHKCTYKQDYSVSSSTEPPCPRGVFPCTTYDVMWKRIGEVQVGQVTAENLGRALQQKVPEEQWL